jgi:hypothetical protein
MPTGKPHIGVGHVSGRIRPASLTGNTGSPSSYADTYHSRVMSTPLRGALEPECDDKLFDCPGKEMEEEEMEEEEIAEVLIREFVRSVLLLEKEEIIDEDELEEEDEVEEASSGGVGGATLPMGMSTPTHGRKRRTPAEAAGSGFGGAKPYMPGKKKSKGKKQRRKSK